MANSYEAMLVFSVANGEETANALTEKFTALIAANGTVESAEVWGGEKHRLAYPINDETEVSPNSLLSLTVFLRSQTAFSVLLLSRNKEDTKHA